MLPVTRSSVVMLLLVGLSSCVAAAGPGFEVPPIESTPSASAARRAPAAATDTVEGEAQAEAEAQLPRSRTSYVLSFAHADEGHALAARHLRFVLESEEVAARAELSDDELRLSGVVERLDERLYVGLTGLSPDARGLVVRMMVEHDGEQLVGWATIDAGDAAVTVPFVAEPATAVFALAR